MPIHKRHIEQKQKNLTLLAVIAGVMLLLFAVTLIRFSVAGG